MIQLCIILYYIVCHKTRTKMGLHKHVNLSPLSFTQKKCIMSTKLNENLTKISFFCVISTWKCFHCSHKGNIFPTNALLRGANDFQSRPKCSQLLYIKFIVQSVILSHAFTLLSFLLFRVGRHCISKVVCTR